MKDSDDEIVLEEEAEEGPAALKKLREKLAACVKEKQEYLEGWQRARADYSNALRQSNEAIRVAEQKGTEKAVESLFPAFDALERAKEHGEMPAGFQAIAKQLESAFGSLGLERIVPQKGALFDPAVHEAIAEDVVSNAQEDGRISRLLESGWRNGSAVIRPAKVAVGVHQK